MVQKEKTLSMREIEILAALTSLGGRSTFEKLYRMVKASPLCKDLKLSGRATFNEELYTLIMKGYVEKVKVGKRSEYRLSKKVKSIPISLEWLERHVKRVAYLSDRLNWLIERGHLQPNISRLFFADKMFIEAMIDDILRRACRDEDIEPMIGELANFIRERASKLKKYHPDAKAEYYRIASADIIRLFYSFENIVANLSK